ncbi:MAG TPA: hypothetical protein VES20_25665, partial [Bryobacteraceae bacterium]|nr:hypothetical protein [Bryobacteraceae bacterium]
EFALGSKVVKSAPYAAEAVTETVQTLGDGNRIVHKSTVQMARDGQGRTRRDLSPLRIGPLAQGNTPKITVIHDPVNDVSYTLDHNAKVARKMKGQGMIVHMSSDEKGEAGAPKDVRNFRMELHSAADVVTAAPVGPVMIRVPKNGTTQKKESLGKQSIEGVVAEGTRTTDTIPAGAVGNERPIEIVNEQWYSPELQTIIMTRHKDPRMGETTYKLTTIRRGEPLPSLFEVPGDYSVTDAPSPRIHMMRRPAPKE